MKPPPQQRPPGAADAALQAAAFALQNGRFADVERIARELLQKNPGDAQAAQLYGYALTAQQRGSEAIVPLERAAQQNKDPAVDTQLGLALRQAGRKEEALERFARAVKRPQPFPPAFLEYGSVLIDAGRIDEALEGSNAGSRSVCDLEIAGQRHHEAVGHGIDERRAALDGLALVLQHGVERLLRQRLEPVRQSFHRRKRRRQHAEKFRRAAEGERHLIVLVRLQSNAGENERIEALSRRR